MQGAIGSRRKRTQWLSTQCQGPAGDYDGGGQKRSGA